MRKAVLVVACMMLLLSTITLAEEPLQAEKYENAKWYWMVDVTFESGQAEEALAFVHKHLFAASKKAGTPAPKILHNLTGKFDVTFLMPMAGGPSDLEWKVSPTSAKWWNALVELEGGSEEAQNAWAEYMDMVEYAEARIVRIDMEEKKDAKN